MLLLILRFDSQTLLRISCRPAPDFLSSSKEIFPYSHAAPSSFADRSPLGAHVHKTGRLMPSRQTSSLGQFLFYRRVRTVTRLICSVNFILPTSQNRHSSHLRRFIFFFSILLFPPCCNKNFLTSSLHKNIHITVHPLLFSSLSIHSSKVNGW